jgi:hypothetical protein
VVRLLKMCLSVSSFCFTEPELWPAYLSCPCTCRCTCAASIEPVLVFREVPLGWFRTPARLTGPLRDPLFELVRLCQIVEGRPKFCSRTFMYFAFCTELLQNVLIYSDFVIPYLSHGVRYENCVNTDNVRSALTSHERSYR